MAKNDDFPINPDSMRPFRIRDKKTKKQLQHRYFSIPYRAHMFLLWELSKCIEGTVFEFFDTRDGHLIGEFVREHNAIRLVAKKG